ncbi:hypothetical protein [Spongiactinospora sp. 9N601]|uniref:hypothetical protein n=1 Tax=Spongiactinospora sp. 9N601 TaxID=3375149 RepID=UPI0037A824B2
MRSTPLDLGNPEFRSAACPPFRMCDYLLKAPTQIQKTADTVDEAVTWLAERFDELAPAFASREAMGPLADRAYLLAAAGGHLAEADSVCWGFWLTAERYGTVAVVHCPDFHAPGYPCPAGRKRKGD